MENIKKYLEQEKPEFNEGFRLLCLYCRNQSLLSYIGRTGSMEHLLYNLRKISKQNVKPNPQAENLELRFNKADVKPVEMAEPIEAPSQDDDSEENEEEMLDEAKLAEEIISHYKNRYKREELTPELQELWDTNTDKYKELRAYHEKMKQCNSDIGRAEFRELVVSLANDIADRYELIAEKMKEYSEKTPETSVPLAKLNSARAYISRMLKRNDLTDEQRLKVQEYYKLLVDNGAEIKEETLQKLRDGGYIS